MKHVHVDDNSILKCDILCLFVSTPCMKTLKLGKLNINDGKVELISSFGISYVLVFSSKSKFLK